MAAGQRREDGARVSDSTPRCRKSRVPALRMRGRVITFTNLFPSACFPTHGLFVRDRMRRVVAATGVAWTVVCPVPRVPKPLRRGDYALHASMPEREVVEGVDVRHPPYRHW